MGRYFCTSVLALAQLWHCTLRSEAAVCLLAPSLLNRSPGEAQAPLAAELLGIFLSVWGSRLGFSVLVLFFYLSEPPRGTRRHCEPVFM